ncbi:pyruvate, partial [Blastocystis sp. ATCC 50177/Nand II]
MRIRNVIQIITTLKKAQFYNIDATAVAQSVGLKQRINMIMQSVFFNLCPILPEGRAPKLLETDIVKKFSSKGKELVDMNLNAVKQSLSNLHKIEVPASWATLGEDAPRVWPAGTPEFLKTLYPALYSEGDTLPVSKFVVGGVQ